MISSPLLSLALAGTAQAAYSFNPLEHLAGIAPYFESPVLDPKPPQGCNVSRAAYLVRHAAIYANDFDYEEYIEPFTDKLVNTTADWRRAGPLDFLATWQSPITEEELEDLTTVGRLEAYKLGVDVRLRYPSFKAPKQVWTSTAERTELSTSSFIDGLSGSSNKTEQVSVPESEARGADSLTPYKGCPKYSSSYGSDQSSEYKEVYTAPIIARLHDLAPGFNFTADDIVGMQELCGYETVIRGSSPFCSPELFSPNEWLAFEYMNDIQYHYNVGYGNQISGVLGFPWLDATTETLFNESAEQDIHVSFTHRELPPTVIVALGIFNNSAFSGANDVNATMPLKMQNYGRAWRSSLIIPFLTNIAIERMTCDSYGFADGDYVRVLVNQSPQPLPCADGPGESCSQAAYQKYIQGRGELFGGYTEKCQPDYTNSTDTLSIYSS
ncbi:phosphoglycerate mutase-like protein [Dothidotthia symphoricarpi CBS 119687]|uniref:Phosphoglycerate mutase-like protein n=1 Tax=Dothidotthia symphoricarpi CBS 119687 TaxID=1392245 RepID=A0A6A6AJ50_9PLEO|nr:phosphoglycerate mutase-like protein [Dothidotthia symphoricarpi CBS 119687]KAF2131969.1 phosphoglycerate mutase-like protein [Dothidotthia symphoricarpi CBS 119687]